MMLFTMQTERFYEKKWFRTLFALLFWLGVWQVVCLAVNQEVLIASPMRVLQRLAELAVGVEFWISAALSMLHILEGFLYAVALGILLAVLTSLSSFFHSLFYPIIGMMKAMPVASFIILALVWLPSPKVPVFASLLVVLPLVWANLDSAIRKTDSKLLEMARCYRFSLRTTLRLVYIPSILPYFMAACTTGMGMAWKAGVAAEVIAITKLSIGGHIYSAKVYLETADLFAWTAVVVVMSILLEKLMVAGMRRAEAWMKREGVKG